MRFAVLLAWCFVSFVCLQRVAFCAADDNDTTVASTTPGTTAPPEIRKQYMIALLWPNDKVIQELSGMYENVFLPKLNRTCRSNGVALPTDFVVTFRVFISPETPSIKYLNDLAANLKLESGFQFIGSYKAPSRSVRQIIKSMGSFHMHHIEPPLFSAMTPGLVKLIRAMHQSNTTGKFADLSDNREISVVLGSNYRFSDVHELAKSFDRGISCYQLGSVDNTLIFNSIYNSNSTTIIVLADRTESNVFVTNAMSNNLWSPEYRWILFDTGRIFEKSTDVVNKRNVSSMEFGPFGPEEAVYFSEGTDRILIYDLLEIWTAYLAHMSCGVKVDGRQVRGLTGLFTLYGNGTLVRNDWTMQIYRNMLSSPELAGNVSSTGAFYITPTKPRSFAREDLLTEYRGKTFLVLSMTDSPFSRYKRGMENQTNIPLDKRLEGLAFDLCMEILQNLNITKYNFKGVRNNIYGQELSNNEWTGAVGILHNGAASLACVDLTITAPRANVIDFTVPYLRTNISILYRVNKTDPANEVFQFLMPFGIDVWLCLGGATLAVAALLTILHRISPNRQPFDFRYSLFFSFTSLFQGIVGDPPDRPSGRIVVAAYWLLAILLLIAYVANYAALRTLDKLEVDISTVTNLLDQSSYTYGTLANSSMAVIFKDSTFADMRLIYERMKRYRNGLFPNYSVGLNAVKRGDFAMVYETPANEYQSQLICDSVLTGHFENVDIAFGLPRRSELRGVINEEITKLVNSGRVSELYNKYFKLQPPQLSNCNQNKSIVNIIPVEPASLEVATGSLSLRNTFGLLIVTFFGCCLTLLVAAIECGLKTLKRWRREKNFDNLEQPTVSFHLRRRHTGRKMANVLRRESQA